MPRPESKPRSTRLVLLSMLAIGAGCSDDAAQPSAAAVAPVVAQQAARAERPTGSETCRECHPDLYRTYRDTVAMARSFYAMTPAEAVEDWTANNTFHHELSGMHYRMERRGDRFFQRRFRLDADGRPVHEFEREVTHVMGSGNHVRTYVHHEPGGRATQLPVSWYAETGTWAMSPGYDREDLHEDFARPVDRGCMFCHNAYPQVPAHDHGDGSTYLGELPHGIDCQRCHGDGERHVALARSADASYDEIVAAVVHPGELDDRLAMDVCLQCHLESAVNPGLPHSLRRFDREIFSFRPGEPLADYLLPFDAADDTFQQDRFEIAHHGYRLTRSTCFEHSGGRLVCTTCHDPHHTPPGEHKAAHFRAACHTCHADDACSQPDDEASRRGVAADNCVGCHMPRRRTIDVVHAVMRDHRIVRRPPAGDLLATLDESQDVYQGELEFLLPQTAPHGPEGDLYLGTAYLQGGVHVGRGIELVERALAAGAEEAVTPLRMVGKAKNARGDHAGALAALERALAHDGDDVGLLVEAGLAELQLGDREAARRRFERALRFAPEHAEALVSLTRLAFLDGDVPAATKLLERAVRAHPENNQVRRIRAQLAMRQRDLDVARRHYQQILRVDALDVDAMLQLAKIARATGAFGEALVRARDVLAIDAANTGAHLEAANVHANAPDALLRDGAAAVAHARQGLPDERAASPADLLVAASAYAEHGTFGEAVRLAEAAAGHAATQRSPALQRHVDAVLTHYRAGRKVPQAR